jgi:signal transduction histidine kinase
MKRRHSLSGRLILLFLITGVLIALTMQSGFRYGIQNELRSLAEPHLLEYIEHLRREIGNPPDPVSARHLAERLSLQIHVLGPEQNWSTDGRPPALTDYRFHRHKLADGSLLEVGRREQGLVVKLTQGRQTLLLIPRNLSESRRLPFAVGLTILLVLAIIALAYHLVKRLFRPIETLREGVGRFGAGDLAHRIRLERRDELGDLAHSINTMADDIHQMLEAKRQLLLAISHELRSPLTRARVNAELLQQSDSRHRIIQDLREMEHRLTELLETERLQGRHTKLNLESVSTSGLIDRVIEESFEDQVIFREGMSTDCRIQVDSVRIRLLIRNLLENALRHTPDHAEPPRIGSECRGVSWRLTITDQGAGIPAEDLPHLTEAFYRADKSRQRRTGGYGLGLYLCRVIAEAHGGNLAIQSEPGVGTQVRVSMPVVEAGKH